MKFFDRWERVLLVLISLVYAAFGLAVDNYLSPASLGDSTYNFDCFQCLTLSGDDPTEDRFAIVARVGLARPSGLGPLACRRAVVAQRCSESTT